MSEPTVPRAELAPVGAISGRAVGSPTSTAPAEVSADVRIFTWIVAVLGLAILAVISVVIARTRLSEVRAGEQAPARARQLVDFQLTDRSGKPVNREELRGKFVIANFVFTSCSLPCLEVNRQMAEIQRQLGDRSDVQLVSFSVDPRTDTPPVLSRFADRFGADPRRWLFLTGEKDTMYRLLGTSFLDPAPAGFADLLPGGFDHTDQIALVDPQGRVRRYFDGLRSGAAAAVLRTIEELRKEP